MDKVIYRRIQRAWQKFDATTAFGCKNKKVPFDPIRCQDAWNEYNRTLANMGIPVVSHTPIGLTPSV